MSEDGEDSQPSAMPRRDFLDLAVKFRLIPLVAPKEVVETLTALAQPAKLIMDEFLGSPILFDHVANQLAKQAVRVVMPRFRCLRLELIKDAITGANPEEALTSLSNSLGVVRESYGYSYSQILSTLMFEINTGNDLEHLGWQADQLVETFTPFGSMGLKAALFHSKHQNLTPSERGELYHLGIKNTWTPIQLFESLLTEEEIEFCKQPFSIGRLSDEALRFVLQSKNFADHLCKPVVQESIFDPLQLDTESLIGIFRKAIDFITKTPSADDGFFKERPQYRLKSHDLTGNFGFITQHSAMSQQVLSLLQKELGRVLQNTLDRALNGEEVAPNELPYLDDDIRVMGRGESPTYRSRDYAYLSVALCVDKDEIPTKLGFPSNPKPKIAQVGERMMILKIETDEQGEAVERFAMLQKLHDLRDGKEQMAAAATR